MRRIRRERWRQQARRINSRLKGPKGSMMSFQEINEELEYRWQSTCLRSMSRVRLNGTSYSSRSHAQTISQQARATLTSPHHAHRPPDSSSLDPQGPPTSTSTSHPSAMRPIPLLHSEPPSATMQTPAKITLTHPSHTYHLLQPRIPFLTLPSEGRDSSRVRDSYRPSAHPAFRSRAGAEWSEDPIVSTIVELLLFSQPPPSSELVS